MSSKINWKQKYFELRSKYMSAIDVSFRLGFEEGQKQAELAAYANLKLVKQQFYLGGVSYLSLLDAERQYQQTRIRLVQAQASRYSDTAALFQALGGGWWTSNCLP